nr:helix-turn-helix domain-containing protein [Gammaproteobacteria bacterium]
MINKKEFGNRLRKIRKERGFSQAELAETIQISIQSLSYYENGKVLPALDYLHDIAAILNVSIDYLLFGEAYAKQLINDEIIKD